MASSTPQQGSTPAPSQQQQGSQTAKPQQQGGATIRDWASI